MYTEKLINFSVLQKLDITWLPQPLLQPFVSKQVCWLGPGLFPYDNLDLWRTADLKLMLQQTDRSRQLKLMEISSESALVHLTPLVVCLASLKFPETQHLPPSYPALTKFWPANRSVIALAWTDSSINWNKFWSGWPISISNDLQFKY
jgi:hypothetical protein